MSRSRGFARERQWAARLRAEGWWTLRAPASLGSVDVIALKDGERPRMYEVKSTAAGPFHSFGPGDRADLLSEAAAAGADAFLVWWPSRGSPRVIAPSEWPKTRRS